MIETTLIPLDDALDRFELEAAHRPLVRQIALRAGIVGCEVKASYVKAIRIDGMHPLHVTHRGVEWFSSRVEAVSASGLTEGIRSKVNRAGTENWSVAFPKVVAAPTVVPADDAPVHDATAASAAPVAPVVGAAGEKAPRASAPVVPSPVVPTAVAPARSPRPVERDYGVCETCWQARTAAGSCGCDD
ncbi:hypothetical protein [Demequina pelophila]|uniref:hypothetical protein n=1 Tax=Demequina pelophila TaxID=1638984 RepID=UPI0007842505|nr:hypothetical protein [Demequina pelophila]